MSTEEAEKVQEILAEGVAREGLQEMVLPAEEAAARRLAAFVSDAAIDKMIADAQDAGVSLLDGPGGLIGQLTARVIERALGAEMDDQGRPRSTTWSGVMTDGIFLPGAITPAEVGSGPCSRLLRRLCAAHGLAIARHRPASSGSSGCTPATGADLTEERTREY